jgi:hypothetical protein
MEKEKFSKQLFSHGHQSSQSEGELPQQKEHRRPKHEKCKEECEWEKREEWKNSEHHV